MGKTRPRLGGGPRPVPVHLRSCPSCDGIHTEVKLGVFPASGRGLSPARPTRSTPGLALPSRDNYLLLSLEDNRARSALHRLPPGSTPALFFISSHRFGAPLYARFSYPDHEMGGAAKGPPPGGSGVGLGRVGGTEDGDEPRQDPYLGQGREEGCPGLPWPVLYGLGLPLGRRRSFPGIGGRARGAGGRRACFQPGICRLLTG
jgi:hypothetical protein